MSERLRRDDQYRSPIISFLLLVAIFVCLTLYEIVSNELAFWEAVTTTMATFGVFVVFTLAFVLLVMIPLSLIGGNRRKKFRDSIGPEKRN